MKTSSPPSVPRRARRLAAVIVGFAAASVALSGCLYAMIPEASPSSTASIAPDTEGVAVELLPFYEQTLSWSSCGGFEGTTVTAPLDWADPGGGEIELS
ncbi:MAG: alpha/beta hydrolase, partial [Microbacterium sp.]